MAEQLNLDEVVRILKDKGIDAYVEQTGGGTATIFAGNQFIDGYGTNRYQACAGPGWFEGPNFTEARADTSEFYVGPDDDGVAEPVDADASWDEARAAEAIAAVVAR